MDSKELQGLLEAYTQVHTTQEVDEAVKGASPHTMEMRKGDAADRRKGIKPLSAKKGEEYAKYKMSQMAYSKRERMGEEVEQIDEVSADLALKASKAADIKRGKLAAAGDKEGAAGKAAQASRLYKAQADRRLGRVTPGKANEEVEQIDEISQRTATSAYAQRRTGEFEGDDASDRVAKTNKLKGRIEKKFGAKAGEHADRAADVKTFGRKDASGRRKQSPQPRIQTSDHENQREFKRELRIKRDRRLRAARGEDTNEQFDIFDAVLEYLVAEGYAATNKEALVIMANMSEEWRTEIIESQYARENPEKYEREQAKAKSKKQKAMEDPHTGINSPAFEKFMRQQMGR